LSLRNAEIGYCPPTIITTAGKRQLIIWHPESINSLDPETGTLYWSEKILAQSNMSIAPPCLDGDHLLISGFYSGSMMLKLDKNKPAETVLWKSKGTGETPTKTDTLHSVMSPVYIKDGYIYGVCSYGELRCLKVEDGSRVWEDLRATGKASKPTERWATAFLTPQGDRWFLFNEKGDLIIAKLSPKGYEEIDRAHLLDPTSQLPAMGGNRKVLWSHPAYANKSIYVRNDKEIVCYSLAAE
jgi:outer membrane protein assembly factor BamB